MRLYALHDRSNEEAGALAYLECYEKDRAFYFELPPTADPWNLPFILHEFAQRGVLTVDAEWSLAWVRARIVPPERQNLGEVLRENGLEEYDELRLLGLTEGRCSQDACYLIPLESGQVPEWYSERRLARMLDACPIDDFRLVVTFQDGNIMLCDAAKGLGGRRQFARVLCEPPTFARVTLQPGGHGVRWGKSLQVSSNTLRQMGTLLPISRNDVLSLASQALCDTSEVTTLLGCTRQNVSDLVRRGRLKPAKATGHVMLFLRSDILAYQSG